MTARILNFLFVVCIIFCVVPEQAFAENLKVLCRYVDPLSGEKVMGAVLDDNRILPLQATHVELRDGKPSPCFETIPDFFKNGGNDAKALANKLISEALEKRRPLLKPEDVKLLAPVDPVKFVAGSIFEGHATQSRAAWAREIFTFQWAIATLIGGGPFKPPQEHYNDVTYYQGNHLGWYTHNAGIPLPHGWESMDFEIEIAMLVIEKDGQFKVGGYFLFNDFTHRKTQGLEINKVKHGFSASKHVNAAGWKLVLAEYVDFSKITATATVIKPDGSTKTLCNGNTEDALFSPEDVLQSIEKRDGGIHHGEVITTGTLTGCCGLEILGAAEADLLFPNDRIRFESGILGDLENKIIQE